MRTNRRNQWVDLSVLAFLAVLALPLACGGSAVDSGANPTHNDGSRYISYDGGARPDRYGDGSLASAADGGPQHSDGAPQPWPDDGCEECGDGAGPEYSDGAGPEYRDGSAQFRDGSAQYRDGSAQYRDGSARYRDGSGSGGQLFYDGGAHTDGGSAHVGGGGSGFADGSGHGYSDGSPVGGYGGSL